jgi:hypothetical protein
MKTLHICLQCLEFIGLMMHAIRITLDPHAVMLMNRILEKLKTEMLYFEGNTNYSSK